MNDSPALFLDRDGVINVDYDYVHRIDEFDFIDGIFDLCRRYQEKNYSIFVVTNQSGIARGRYSEADFAVLSDWMVAVFKAQGVTITAVYHCPHHPDITGPCDCRKPRPGMLLRAATEHGVDLAASVLIGDKERDVEAGCNAGLRETYLYAPHGADHPTRATGIITTFEELP